MNERNIATCDVISGIEKLARFLKTDKIHESEFAETSCKYLISCEPTEVERVLVHIPRDLKEILEAYAQDKWAAASYNLMPYQFVVNHNDHTEIETVRKKYGGRYLAVHEALKNSIK